MSDTALPNESTTYGRNEANPNYHIRQEFSSATSRGINEDCTPAGFRQVRFPLLSRLADRVSQAAEVWELLVYRLLHLTQSTCDVVFRSSVIHRHRAVPCHSSPLNLAQKDFHKTTVCSLTYLIQSYICADVLGLSRGDAKPSPLCPSPREQRR